MIRIGNRDIPEEGDERSRDEAAAAAAEILAQYTAGWSDEDVRDALSDLEGVTVHTWPEERS